jgi:hypothetical protein
MGRGLGGGDTAETGTTKVHHRLYVELGYEGDLPRIIKKEEE